MKQQLSSEPVLAHYNSSLPLRLACDASPYGVGVVISHIMPNGEEKPIAYGSRTLSKAERNYAQVEKEALAIIFGIKKFHQYIYGRKFLLVTDHKPLTSILSPKASLPALATARLQRWAITLSAYHYEIQFRPTTQHANADSLSRLPLENTPTTDINKSVISFNRLVHFRYMLSSYVKKHQMTHFYPKFCSILRKVGLKKLMQNYFHFQDVS